MMSQVEHNHGWKMHKVFCCAGPKKKVQPILDYFSQIQKEGKIKVVSRKLRSKRLLIWNYDELQILFQILQGHQILVPDKLLDGLDFSKFKENTMIMMEFAGPSKEDKLMKVNILTLCQPYISRGVNVKIDITTKKESAYITKYKCMGRVHGPVDTVLNMRDMLITHDYCLADSINIQF